MMNALFVFLLLIPSFSSATGIKLTKTGSNIDLRVSDVPMPMEELRKDLNSGLSTVLVGTIVLWEGETVLSKTSLIWKVYYDLWDEVFHLQRIDGDRKVSLRNFKKSEVTTALSSYVFPSILSLEDIKRTSNLSATFSLVIDPISKEKRKKIKKWLAQSQVSVPSSQPSASSSKPSSPETTTRGLVYRGVFGQMLDSELGEDVDPGKWTYSSPKMSLPVKELNSER